MHHPLLEEQIRKHLGAGKITPELRGLLQAVHSTYTEHGVPGYAPLSPSLTADDSELKYQRLFEKMADGVYKSSSEGRFIEVNPALIRMLGYNSKEEVLKIDIKSELYFSPDERDKAVEEDNKDGKSVFKLRKKDGSAIWVEDRGQYVCDDNGNILFHEGMLRDVTDRVNAQIQLLEVNNNLKVTIEQLAEAQHLAHLGSWLYDVATVTGEYSAEYYKIFETTPEEFAAGLKNFVDYFHPDDRDTVRNTFRQAIIDKQPYQYQSRLITKDGRVKFIQTNAKCIVDSNGDVVKLHGTIQDITEQKIIQEVLEKNIAELKKSNLELDKFVYSVSHDLRAPLSSMLGIIDLSVDDTEDELMIERLDMLKSNIKKLDGFITDILDYSRNARLEVRKEEINFRDMLKDITQNLKFMGANNRMVEIKVAVNEKAVVRSDKSRISVIFNNLISNAMRYQNEQVENPFVDVEINTSDTETDIIVRDNGIGISRENQSKIFDMFYRVSEASVGSGLGLYIVKEAVAKLNGNIKVESEPGTGTAFIINIPNN